MGRSARRVCLRGHARRVMAGGASRGPRRGLRRSGGPGSAGDSGWVNKAQPEAGGREGARGTAEGSELRRLDAVWGDELLGVVHEGRQSRWGHGVALFLLRCKLQVQLEQERQNVVAGAMP